MAKEKQLPQKLFVKWNMDSDEPFLHADTTIDALSEENETIPVGIYKLMQKAKVVNRTTLE